MLHALRNPFPPCAWMTQGVASQRQTTSESITTTTGCPHLRSVVGNPADTATGRTTSTQPLSDTTGDPQWIRYEINEAVHPVDTDFVHPTGPNHITQDVETTWCPPTTIPVPHNEGPSNRPLPAAAPRAPQRRLRLRDRSYQNCARDFTDNPPIQRSRLQPNHNCSHCNALLIPHETQESCCMNGSIRLETPHVPDSLLSLYTSDSQEARHFRENIRAYNHVFSSTSMGVHIDDGHANARDGVYTYRALGSVYQRIGSLLPQHAHRPRYLQM